MGHMSLPPGFRFHPTDDELVGYYLKRKVDGIPFELEVIPVIELYKFDPWELPDKSFLPRRDMEWFFFCPRDRKYPNGSRTNRATSSGYWKATGKDRKVFCESSVQGLRKTLVFYRGRAPGGGRTEWVMHEYRLCEDLSQPCPNFLGQFALCRVVKRNEVVQKTGDSKGKRNIDSVTKDISTSKKHSSIFEISQESTQISSSEVQPFPTITDENIWGPTDFSISPVSSYSSFTDEIAGNGDLSTFFTSPLHNVNVYNDLENMAIQNFDWELPISSEFSNVLPFPSICRQASEGEDVGLWLQEDSLMVVM